LLVSGNCARATLLIGHKVIVSDVTDGRGQPALLPYACCRRLAALFELG